MICFDWHATTDPARRGVVNQGYRCRSTPHPLMPHARHTLSVCQYAVHKKCYQFVGQRCLGPDSLENMSKVPA